MGPAAFYPRVVVKRLLDTDNRSAFSRENRVQ